MVRDEKPRTVYWLDDKLYLNITNKCSNKCIFCFRNFKRGIADFTLKLNEEPSFEQIALELDEAMKRKKWKEVVFCGFGEPTERLDILLEVARWVRAHYGRPLAIRLDTNGHGYALNPRRDVVAELKAAGIDEVSVSLNAGEKETYDEICKPALPDAYEMVLDFIRKAKLVFDVEVTAVRLPEVDLAKVQAAADGLGVPFSVREYIPCFY